jgi:hypothetical protein
MAKAVEDFSAKQFTEDVMDNITLYAPCAMGQVVSRTECSQHSVPDHMRVRKQSANPR